VRSFEVWRDRKSWNEWTVYNLQEPIKHDDGNHAEPWNARVGTLTSLVKRSKSDLEDENLELAITQTEEGHDGILKALLLSCLPRLRDLKFITQAHDQRSTLSWLSIFVNSRNASASFNFLTSVAVGIPSNTWMDDTNSPTLPARIFSTLLTLPKIESIYYNDLICEETDEFDWKDIIPARSSNVKHIFLDDCNNIPFELQDALTAAPKGLISMSFRAGAGSGDRMDDMDRLVSWLGEHDRQSSSLEALMFYGYRDENIYHRIHGYRCTVYRPEELRNLALRDVSLDIQDIELDAFYNWDDPDEQKQTKMAFWKDYVVNNLPETMETLVLWDEPGSGHFGDELGETEYVEAMVVALMEADNFQELTAVYLEEVERRAGEGRNNSPRADKIAFQHAIALGKRKGIDVYTITNRRTPRNEQVFPEAPDVYDLVTGPYKGRRPEGFVFDVYQGRRVPPGCGKCGTCEQCLAEYTRDLWAKVPSKEEADEGEADASNHSEDEEGDQEEESDKDEENSADEEDEEMEG
jgi:hypothetical protein